MLEELRRTISIIIIDDEIEEFKEIGKAHTKWQLRENEYHKLILTSYCELHIIEMPKAIREYEKNRKDGLLQWMMFLNNPENMEVTRIMNENEDIKEAKDELDKISRDDVLRRMALKAELERMDNEQRIYEAERNGKREVAKKMLEEKMSIETIIKLTGLKQEEIEKLLEA